jgi:arylsulfatase A-like enzyme
VKAPTLSLALSLLFCLAAKTAAHDLGVAHSDGASGLWESLLARQPRDPAGRAAIEAAIAHQLLQADVSRTSTQSAPAWFAKTAAPVQVSGKPPTPRTIRSNRPRQITTARTSSSLLTATSSPLVAAREALAFTAPAGNGALMAASFAPFKPRVRYYWDATTFYEEADGMPDNTMMPNLMTGITSWQQQVPLPAAYFASTTNPENNTGSLGYQQPNYWRLPLVPVPSGSPIAISSGNFQRGAVALAANGVPIFNPKNNTGRVSYEIGELDAYGGHCGLADDYHYHIIPTHLLSQFGGVLSNDKPVAWSLDGYPIYGFVEPDGSARQALDADGGHDIGNGWGYHYHAIGTTNVDASHPYGTPQTPYLMSAFHGTVVNFGGQVDGQPEVGSIRASGTGGYTAQPVSGASIVAFKNPVALTTDGSGHLIENVGGTASQDSYLMRVNIGGTNYDECWKINRGVNPRTLTITWRLSGATTTTTYTPNAGSAAGNRLAAYTMGAWSETKLPDTSQTQDTTATFGEDADYSINAQSFTDNGNGTITDNVTGLMWQKTDNGESTWENAVTNAAGVSTGGYSDWRLPTPAELFSIFNHQNQNPALNTTFFPNNGAGAAEYWWTSDAYGSSTTNVWCANSGGGLGGKPKSETLSAGGSLRYHARYVRGAKPTNLHRYLNNLDGTITDTDTGLMWTQVPGTSATWDAALSYAENLTLAGYADWRLPNVKELETLTDYTLATATNTTGIKPCINRTLFPAATATAYWSSTSLRGDTTKAWLVEFGINNSVPAANGPTRNSQGIISYEAKTSSYPVFAVRTTSAIVIPPPTISGVTAVPTVPGDVDTPFIKATVTPASGATIAGVQLIYNTGAQVTTTVFAETMANTATGGTGGWDGTGAIYPWTVTSTAGAGNVKQSTAANHGSGNVCGLEFGKGTASAAATMAATTNAIDASGTAAYVEFWAATSNLTAGLGWNFQLSTDGSTWTTRLAESAGTNHAHQLFHYDLAAAERVSTLRIRFQFIGNGTGGPTGPKTYVDDISVVATSGAAPVNVTMLDDGAHGDGAAGDGVYGGQLPAQISGTTVSYTITATDSNASVTTASGSYTTGPTPSITTSATLPQATVSGVYAQTLAAAGGTGTTYAWSVSAGSLPPGLTLSSAGVLSGTVNTAGTYNFTLKVTDSAGRIATKAFTLVVSTTTAPNVVIILTDDQGWADVGYHTASGQVPVQTPNMDALGTSGIRLEKFYATPVCAVSRACLLTGRNSLRTNAGNQRGLALAEHLMPQTFKAVGYQTFMCGKWHDGGTANNINTTTLNGSTFSVIQEGTEYLPHNRGWDLHYGQYGGAIGYFSHASVDPGLNNGLDWWLNGAPVVESTDQQGNGGYSTDLLADKAVSKIVTRDKTKPMLLYLAFNGVHAGVQAPPSYITKYQNLGVAEPRRTLCAAVDCMDVAMGRVLAALASEGIADNTVVIFMSDNGGSEPAGSLNDPLRGTKNDSYDGGIHTPAAIRWPNHLAAGVTSNQYVWIGDIFPTLCAAVGVTPQNTKPLDGVNLWPALQSISAGSPNGAARGVPLVTGDASGPVALDTFTDPVNGGSKVFKLIRNKVSSTVTNELFNLTGDPYETTDLLLGANAASYSTIVTTLTAAITGIAVENYPPYIGPPSITQSVPQGGSTTLYAPFTSYKAPSVQWRKNGTNLSGATTFYQVTDSTGSAVNGVYMTTLTLTNVNGTHTANYDIVITNVAGTRTSAAGALTVTHPLSTQNDGLPDAWKIAHGIDPSSSAAINGPLGDLDHDGQSNLFEYAFNTDPQATQPDPVHVRPVTKAADGLNYLEVSYPRRIGALDLSYAVEVSDDLTTWPSPGASLEPVSVTPNADGITETVTVRALPAISSTPKKFVRVKVTAQ